MTAHVFYPDLASEILACHRRLPPGSPLFLTTPVTKLDETRAAFGHVEACNIIAVPNRGRDIAPFLALLQDGVFDGFDAVLKIHTKRSLHLGSGDARRRLLFASLANGPGKVDAILSSFNTGSVGIVGWSRAWRASGYYWMANRPHVERLCKQLDLPFPDATAFFEGSMFWFRPSALRSLAKATIPLDAFEAEAGQVDGCFHHAIERIFPLVASVGGFSTVDQRGRVLLRAMMPIPVISGR